MKYLAYFNKMIKNYKSILNLISNNNKISYLLMKLKIKILLKEKIKKYLKNNYLKN